MMISRRLLHVAICLASWLLAAPPAEAQNAVGLDGIFSKQLSNTLRQENAFGVGLTYTYDLGELNVNIPKLGRPRLKILGALDLEVINGELEPPACREDHPTTGEFNFYKDCSRDVWIDPSKAEASPPLRVFGALYVAVDAWRFRFGYSPLTGHIHGNDASHSFLVGFAMTPLSWFMLEFPEHGGWRMRIEGAFWAEPLLTF